MNHANGQFKQQTIRILGNELDIFRPVEFRVRAPYPSFVAADSRVGDLSQNSGN
jgi:hypothetical protein